jgi:hypothetical protein
MLLATLPTEIRLHIASYLDLLQRFRLASVCRVLAKERASLLLEASILDGDVLGAQQLLKSGARFDQIHRLLSDTFLLFGYSPEVRLLLKHGAAPARLLIEADRLLEQRSRAGDIAFLLHAGAKVQNLPSLRRSLELLDKKKSLKDRLLHRLDTELHDPESYKWNKNLIISLNEE